MRGCSGTSAGHVPLHSDVDLPPMHAVEEALHQRGPLQGEGRDQKVEPHAAEAISLQEGHEEAETDEDHHVHILETCTIRKTSGVRKLRRGTTAF